MGLLRRWRLGVPRAPSTRPMGWLQGVSLAREDRDARFQLLPQGYAVSASGRYPITVPDEIVRATQRHLRAKGHIRGMRASCSGVERSRQDLSPPPSFQISRPALWRFAFRSPSASASRESSRAAARSSWSRSDCARTPAGPCERLPTVCVSQAHDRGSDREVAGQRCEATPNQATAQACSTAWLGLRCRVGRDDR